MVRSLLFNHFFILKKNRWSRSIDFSSEIYFIWTSVIRFTNTYLTQVFITICLDHILAYWLALTSKLFSIKQSTSLNIQFPSYTTRRLQFQSSFQLKNFITSCSTNAFLPLCCMTHPWAPFSTGYTVHKSLKSFLFPYQSPIHLPIFHPKWPNFSACFGFPPCCILH